ncbi:hypothetical protein HYC85_017354 [Camellia sinensis]|uniref:Uncharacterized protein n=1 Tax=Camellia sinensis TaxID=4442 RepID=A0A7J7H5T6_CAMSI|nr:hypothetical protein HYC85_017354 [Camellia sinensis]
MIANGIEDEEKWLTEGIAGIQHNAFYMHRALLDQSLKDLHKTILGSVSQQQQQLRCMEEHVSSFLASKYDATQILESRICEPEIAVSSVKSSGSVSPRLQQKKLELEKRSRLPTPPDSSKSRSQSPSMKAAKYSVSGIDYKFEGQNKTAREKEKDLQDKIEELERRLDELSQNSASFYEYQFQKVAEVSEDIPSNGCIHEEVKTKDDNLRRDQENLGELLSEMALLKERNKSMEGELKEVQERYSEISLKFAEVEGEGQQLVMTLSNILVLTLENRSPKLAARLNEDGVLPEFGLVAPEHRSPVSVLDDTMYRDDALSLVKQMPDVLKGSALLY